MIVLRPPKHHISANRQSDVYDRLAAREVARPLIEDIYRRTSSTSVLNSSISSKLR